MTRPTFQELDVIARARLHAERMGAALKPGQALYVSRDTIDTMNRWPHDTRGVEINGVAEMIGCTPRCVSGYAREWGFPSKYKLTQEQEDEIRRGLEAGERYRAIATRADCAVATVEKRAISLGLTSTEVKKKRRPRTHDAAAVHRAEIKQETKSRAERSAERQLRAHRARQAMLAALREMVPGYDGKAHGRSGLYWPVVPRHATG